MRILFHGIIRIIMRLVFGFHTEEPLGDRQYILVANHNTHLDVFALFMLFPLGQIHRVHAVAAADYFGRGLKGNLARVLFNAILIERGGGGASLEPVRNALRKGESIVVFPEGTRGEPGKLAHFKSGIGYLVLEFPDIPLILAGLKGIERTLPKNDYILVPFCFSLRHLPPATGYELAAEYGHDGKAIASGLEARLSALLIAN